MNDMVVKSVDLMGDTVMAAQDSEGNIWAGINFFCRGLGMSKRQRDFQVEKVKADKALSKGCTLLRAGVLDTANEVYALRLDFVPIWLSKITITKKMEQENPELADKLLEYQLKAKDILAEAFLPKQEVPRTVPGQIQLLAQGNVELNKRVDKVSDDVKTVKAEIEALRDDLPLFPGEAKTISDAVKKKGVEVMGGKQSPAYKNKSLQHRVYTNIYSNLKYNFDVSSYFFIKRGNKEKALKIVEEYKPPFFIAEQISDENAQQQLNL